MAPYFLRWRQAVHEQGKSEDFLKTEPETFSFYLYLVRIDVPAISFDFGPTLLRLLILSRDMLTSRLSESYSHDRIIP